jgi:hypothetical protein
MSEAKQIMERLDRLEVDFLVTDRRYHDAKEEIRLTRLAYYVCDAKYWCQTFRASYTPHERIALMRDGAENALAHNGYGDERTRVAVAQVYIQELAAIAAECLPLDPQR